VSNAVFLLAAVGASVLGSVVLWLRHRTPRDTMSSIDAFQREMHALAHGPGEPKRRESQRNARPEPIVPAQPDPERVRQLREARRRGGE
jgi:hypothetical protein